MFYVSTVNTAANHRTVDAIISNKKKYHNIYAGRTISLEKLE